MFSVQEEVKAEKSMAWHKTLTHNNDNDSNVLHAKPWIPGGEKSIFTVFIHYLRSSLRQFARARTIDEYDVKIQVSHVRVTSQINCDDVTMLSRKRPSLAAMAKWAIDDCL